MMKCKDARSIPPVKQQQLRESAVELVLSGKSIADVSKHLLVSRQAIHNWMRRYLAAGQKGLKGKTKGRSKGRELQPWQNAQVVYKIKNYYPDELSMPFSLWTRDAVKMLISHMFGLSFSKWTVGRYLKDWGFTPQKPIRKAIEQNPLAIKKWLEIEYPRICRDAKQEKALIYWGDEMGLKSEHNSGRTYAVKGKTPVIARTGKRFSCNMISAISNLGKLSFMIYRENFTEEIFLNFLKRFIRNSSKKVILIVDRYQSHRSKVVMAWLQAHKDRIRLEFLPPYCPELNPDELLNQDIKMSMGKKRPRNESEMIKNLSSYLRMRQKQPSIIQKFISGCHHRYAR